MKIAKQGKAKTRISATRFITGMLCSLYFRWQQDGGIIPSTPPMDRGKRIHKQVENWALGLVDVPSGWKILLPERDEIKEVEQFIGWDEVIRAPELPEKDLICRPDMVLFDGTIVDIKTGENKSPTDIWQVAFNKYLYELKYGEKIKVDPMLIYLDQTVKPIVYSKAEVTGKMIKDVWNRAKVKNPKATQSHLCEWCEIRNQCPEFATKIDAPIGKTGEPKKTLTKDEKYRKKVVDEMISIKAQLKGLEVVVENAVQNDTLKKHLIFVKTKSDEIKVLKSRKSVLDDEAKKFPVHKYVDDDNNYVNVYETEKMVLSSKAKKQIEKLEKKIKEVKKKGQIKKKIPVASTNLNNEIDD